MANNGWQAPAELALYCIIESMAELIVRYEVSNSTIDRAIQKLPANVRAARKAAQSDRHARNCLAQHAAIRAREAARVRNPIGVPILSGGPHGKIDQDGTVRKADAAFVAHFLRIARASGATEYPFAYRVAA